MGASGHSTANSTDAAATASEQHEPPWRDVVVAHADHREHARQRQEHQRQVRLKEAGVDFVILERADEVGGPR